MTVTASRISAAPWLIEHEPWSVALVRAKPGIAPGTVLERCMPSWVWAPWDGYGEPARGVLLGYEGNRARVITRDAIVVGRYLRSGEHGRRGCLLEARGDLAIYGIKVRG